MNLIWFLLWVKKARTHYNFLNFLDKLLHSWREGSPKLFISAFQQIIRNTQTRMTTYIRREVHKQEYTIVLWRTFNIIYGLIVEQIICWQNLLWVCFRVDIKIDLFKTFYIYISNSSRENLIYAIKHPSLTYIISKGM